jgi:hypothetical protein
VFTPGDGKSVSTSGGVETRSKGKVEEEDPEKVRYVVARTEKTIRRKTATGITTTTTTTTTNPSGKNAADMEEYFRVRRQQALELATEEEKRDKVKKSGRLAMSSGRLYRECVGKIAESRKGVSTERSVTVIRTAYNQTWLGPMAESEVIDDSTDNVSTFRHLLYSSEEVTERPGPDGPGVPAVRYKIALHCLSRGTKENKMLELWEVPKTGSVIKVGVF